MIGVLKITAALSLVMGLILVALSVYLYVSRNIRAIERDLKTTKKVSEKKYDTDFTNSIYYKAEAENSSKKNITPVKATGFKREQEKLARNDTRLLMNLQQPDLPKRKTALLEQVSAENVRSTLPLNATRPNTLPLDTDFHLSESDRTET